MKKKIIDWLKLPETKKIRNWDTPATTVLHVKIIQKKPFLKKLYFDFYREFKKSVSDNIEKKVLIEIGSVGDFIKEIIPNALTSNIIKLPNVDKCFSALNIPFKDGSTDGFLMIDVLHHIDDPAAFLKEVNRCLKVGGKLMMIEPGNTLWSRFVFKNFHREPFDLSANWQLEKTGPLSSANSALPWIIFFRDRKRFEKEFPSLKIVKLRHHTPFRRLISGGVTMRQLLPSFTYNIIKGIEWVLSPFNKYLGIHLTIILEKKF